MSSSWGRVMTTPASVLRIALVGPATIEMLQQYFDAPIETAGYAYPLLPLLAAEYRRLGHHVSIITTASDIVHPLEYHGERISLFVAPSRKRAKKRALDFFAIERKRLIEAISKCKPDIIHAHWTYEFALAGLRSGAAPVLVTAHDAPLSILRYMPNIYRTIRALMALEVSFKTRHLTAVSPSLARRWHMQMAYVRPILVIPNPVEPLAITPHVRSRTPLILAVGDDSRRKNFSTLLKSFAIVRGEWPDSRLRLVGPGLESDGELARWAHKKGLGDSVAFVGAVTRSELTQELSTATVFCHPSLEESFGVVIVEALLAGLPVVAGRYSGGVPFVLFDGKAGLLVDVRNTTTLARGIAEAVLNRAGTRTEHFDVQSAVQRNFSAEVVAKRYLEEYANLIAPPGYGTSN
jgi:L-malate glycosyltransferase